MEKTQGYAVGDVIDAGALLVAAPIPPDCAAFADSTLTDALRRDVLVWKTLLLDSDRLKDRHHDGIGPTFFEYAQACLDRRLEQLAVATGDGDRVLRFGRAIKGAVSKSQIKRMATLWDVPEVEARPDPIPETPLPYARSVEPDPQAPVVDDGSVDVAVAVESKHPAHGQDPSPSLLLVHEDPPASMPTKPATAQPKPAPKAKAPPKPKPAQSSLF